MARTKKVGEFYKVMERSEKAVEKRLLKETNKFKNKEIEDLEDVIIHLQQEIEVLKAELKEAKAALKTKQAPKSQKISIDIEAGRLQQAVPLVDEVNDDWLNDLLDHAPLQTGTNRG